MSTTTVLTTEKPRRWLARRRDDVEALRGVGLGIAMANGSNAAKEAATRTSSWEYTDDAVAKELAQLVVDGAFGPGVRLGGAGLG